MRSFLSASQRARVHGVVARELAVLRDHALAHHADPAEIDDEFRRRADQLAAGPAGPLAPPHPQPTEPDRPTEDTDGSPPPEAWPAEADYSVWW